MNIEVTVTPTIINVTVTPRVVEVVVTPPAPIAVSLDPGGVSAALLAGHVAAVDPHPQYATDDDVAAALAGVHTHANKTALDAVSGVNTGDQTRESLGLAVTDTVQFAEIIIPGLVPGTAYKLVVDGDGLIGTEQVL